MLCFIYENVHVDLDRLFHVQIRHEVQVEMSTWNDVVTTWIQHDFACWVFATVFTSQRSWTVIQQTSSIK